MRAGEWESTTIKHTIEFGKFPPAITQTHMTFGLANVRGQALKCLVKTSHTRNKNKHLHASALQCIHYPRPSVINTLPVHTRVTDPTQCFTLLSPSTQVLENNSLSDL